ncbi:PAS domain S-box-containing protein [Halopseudomonas sabulinigri]|uniref:histidine kinase n=1 Tax=Halopseudomonas sabulinigri TaxID=472181 RepID=A0A1H1XWV0_9GAMM|nr:NahK/ErcS family hybrid sensor histidine kinase/response regulator [Halopseudomonas sabulinigri]SDT13643.1 PAS domain S-box-containing protein [Halopseudomonas sabulinigri]
MPKPSDPRREVLTGLLGLGSQSSRKSYYPELSARLEELEAERNRYKWLFENAVHGIFQASLGKGLLTANQSLARMLGYGSVTALVAARQSLEQGFFISADEFQRVRRHLLLQGELTGYETRLARADGSLLDVRMNILLRPDAADHVIEAFVADVTERKQAQVAMQQLNDELEQRVQARTRELETLNESLRFEIIERERTQCELREARDVAEQANRSKDRYLAAASHDLLQPLNAARLLMATLRDSALPASAAQMVERSHTAMESAEDMLSDLLDISRLDQPNLQAEFDDYAIADVIEPLLSEFHSVAQAGGVTLRGRLPNRTVHTDYRLLSRILRNFISNAIRYTERGGVLVGCRVRGEQLCIQVWDTGRGIERQDFRRIFQEFNQLEVGKAGQRKGVGLGLAIVERIARLLRVRIEVQSQVGRGSVFSVSVPLAPDLPTRAASNSLLDSLAVPLQGRRLLVIDNEEIILQSMQSLLQQWGAEVVLALDADAALAALAGVPPDAILVDYHLDNGLTGCDAVSQLRAHFAQPLPAIMITADRTEHCQQVLRDMAMPILNKPLKAGKLRAMLGKLLQP